MLEDKSEEDSGSVGHSPSEPSSEPISENINPGEDSSDFGAGERVEEGMEGGQQPDGDRGNIPPSPPTSPDDVPVEGPTSPQEGPTVPPESIAPGGLVVGPRVGPGPGGGGEGGPGPGIKKKSSSKKAITWVIEITIMLVIAALIAIMIQSFGVKAFMIPSSSMSPTLKIGDRVLVDRVTYYFRKPWRGDVIVFRYPPREPLSLNTSNPLYWPFERIGETLHITNRGSIPYIKRVVATEGETVELRKGKLYIDGKEVEEDYLKSNPDTTDFGPVLIPEGHVFAMGDNRTASRDSRSWGTVPIRSIIGRAFLIWWPLSRMKTI